MCLPLFLSQTAVVNSFASDTKYACSNTATLRSATEQLRYQISLFCMKFAIDAIDSGCTNPPPATAFLCPEQMNLSYSSLEDLVNNATICPSPPREYSRDQLRNFDGTEPALLEYQMRIPSFKNDEALAIGCTSATDSCCVAYRQKVSPSLSTTSPSTKTSAPTASAAGGSNLAPSLVESPGDRSYCYRSPCLLLRAQKKTQYSLGRPTADANSAYGNVGLQASSLPRLWLHEPPAARNSEPQSTRHLNRNQPQQMGSLGRSQGISTAPAGQIGGMDALRGNTLSHGGSGSLSRPGMQPQAPSTEDPTQATRLPRDSVATDLTTDDIVSANTMRVIHAYNPTLTDELPLVLGEDIIVLMSFDDGWGLGLNPTTGAQGAFPLVCVASLDEAAANAMSNGPKPQRFSKRISSAVFAIDGEQMAVLRQSVIKPLAVNPPQGYQGRPTISGPELARKGVTFTEAAPQFHVYPAGRDSVASSAFTSSTTRDSVASSAFTASTYDSRH
ncbi:hypothetical protein BC829DRAFT_485911 [Chytridium lagenaria]|nr:hypothetical protein BC829DRAFT_485911 [Chytridium lagenaria]